MRTGWFIPALTVAVALVAACQDSRRGAAERCDSSLDCPDGTWCSLSTRTCVEAQPLDAVVDTTEADTTTGEDIAADVAAGCVEGAACDDSNPCTHDDACKGGACKGTTYSCDDGIACTVDTCDGLGSCAYSVAAAKCFIDSACFAAGPDPDEPCRQCIPATSQTEWQLADSVACDDGDPCTTGDTCALGVCTAGSDDCDDGNPCTDDACDAETGCTHTPIEGACDDGDPCTGPDTCVEGECVGGEACLCTCATDADCESAAVNLCLGPIVCAPGPEGCGTQCILDTTQAIVCDTSGDTVCSTTECNPTTAACEATSAPEGTACDDGNATTSGDACKGGVCEGKDESCLCGTDSDCDVLDDDNLCNGTFACNGCQCFISPGSVVTCPTDGDTQCAKAACAPSTGACAPKPVPDGTSCDDGDGNTTDDICTGGVCKGS